MHSISKQTLLRRDRLQQPIKETFKGLKSPICPGRQFSEISTFFVSVFQYIMAFAQIPKVYNALSMMQIN